MKRHLLILFAALLPLVASAEKVEIDGIWYNLVSKVKAAEVTSGDTKYSGSITIPATVTHDGVQYSVTSIESRVFWGCSSLTAINIPEGVTSIGSYAFCNCSSLTAIIIPESVTSIGGSAFWGCSSLTAITLPESVTSIGSSAFSGCSSLTAINIPEGVTSIGSGAFYGCSSLTAITLPEGVTSIGYYAFSGCSSLTAINIPEGVTSIGSETFYGCSSLTAITIPEGVTSIGSWAFYDCSSLTDITVASKNSIYDSRNNCNAIIETNSNTLIAGCSSTIIPEGVTTIGEYAFSGCSRLTAITIPEGVTSIGSDAFSGCSSLNAITLPEGVTSIGYEAFRDCSSLTAITLPESVTSIECSVFSGCSRLTAITIPEGVTSIEFCAFENCSSLTAITIPEGVTSIGFCAFENCSSLTAITIPEGVTSIEKNVFYSCSSLTTIVLPKNLKNIYSSAFAGCPELTDVYCYAESVPSANSNAFDGSYPVYATLHVPASALNDYKNTAPWSSFGTIVGLGAAITRITLDKTSATLTEGDELTLKITTTPDDADMNLISWSSSNPSVATVDNNGKVIAIAKGTATITAMANDGSGVSASCEVTVNELILGKCATPSISYTDGKVVFACDTEEATVKSSTTVNGAGNRNVLKFDLIPTYTITAYATKEHYEKSDEVTLTLCWVPCTEEHENEETGILTIPAKPVLISTQGGTITVSGLAAGTEVIVTNTAGTLLATATATDGTATLTTGLEAGSIAIVKIGDYSIKVAIK